MHLRVNEHGLPLQIELSPGQAHDAPMAELLLQDLPKGTTFSPTEAMTPTGSGR